MHEDRFLLIDPVVSQNQKLGESIQSEENFETQIQKSASFRIQKQENSSKIIKTS